MYCIKNGYSFSDLLMNAFSSIISVLKDELYVGIREKLALNEH